MNASQKFRMLLITIMTALLTGCSSPPSAPVDAGHQHTCNVDGGCSPGLGHYMQWTVTAPTAIDGSSATGAGQDLWSVAPEGGDILGLTFRVPDVGFRFEVPRATVTIGRPADIAGASLLAWLGSDPGASWRWSGTYTVTRDDATGWSITIDATSADDWRLTGSWSGDQ